MNCDDYLAMLETLPVEELTYGEARHHAAQCHDCNRITRVVAERERNMIMALGDARSSVSASGMAREALDLARRRRVASYYRAALTLATVGAVIAVVFTRRVVPRPTSSPVVHESFHLQCLSPDQAAVLLRDSGIQGAIRIRPPSTIAVIDVETSAEEFPRIVALIDRYDNPKASTCAAQIVVPKLDESNP
jgi:hypothetical protein